MRERERERRGESKREGEVGRCNALQLWDATARSNIHAVFDIDEDLQILAVARNAEVPWDPEVARRGVELLRLGGAALREKLLAAGLLEKMPHPDPEVEAPLACMVLSKVLRHFSGVAYVSIHRHGEAHPMHCTWKGSVCTCLPFCLYGTCEHDEFSLMLDLRVRPRCLWENPLPVARRRGRKAGATLTRRGEATFLLRTLLLSTLP